MDYGEDVYSLIQTFPQLERFNLTSQLLRASDSVALTISEGSILQSKAEFNRHYSHIILVLLFLAVNPDLEKLKFEVRKF